MTRRLLQPAWARCRVWRGERPQQRQNTVVQHDLVGAAEREGGGRRGELALIATGSPVSTCCPYLTLAYVPCATWLNYREDIRPRQDTQRLNRKICMHLGRSVQEHLAPRPKFGPIGNRPLESEGPLCLPCRRTIKKFKPSLASADRPKSNVYFLLSSLTFPTLWDCGQSWARSLLQPAEVL